MRVSVRDRDGLGLSLLLRLTQLIASVLIRSNANGECPGEVRMSYVLDSPNPNPRYGEVSRP